MMGSLARGRRRMATALLVTLLLVAHTASAVATDGVFAEEVARLNAADAVNNDWYGDSVDIAGDWAVVGAPGDDTQCGSAYLYERTANGWVYRQKLTAPIRAVGENYGSAVAIYGDILVVGAPFTTVDTHPQAGRAYVYERIAGVWTLRLNIPVPVPHDNDHFGWSVDVYGDTVAIGEPGFDDALGNDHGMAWVYYRSGGSWYTRPPLEDPGVGAYNELGWSVAVSPTSIIAGAPGDSSSRGSVSEFTWNGAAWAMAPRLYVSGGLAGDRFGNDLDVSGTTLVVGAYGRDLTAGLDAGVAYVFARSGGAWAWQASLMSPDPSEYASFGWAVGVDGDTIAIGECQGSAGAGAAYFYRRSGTTWPRVQDLEMSAAAPAVRMYGCSTAVSRGTIIVGSYLASTGAVSQCGGAFIYSHLEPVYRFYNPGAGTHFYTNSAAERDHVIATWPTVFSYEGVVYKTNPDNNPQALYRFYKPSSSSHFYTASDAEAAHVMATWPDVFTYEGRTYAVTPWPCAGPTVYRFYNLKNGSHFYTASAVERDHVIATWPTVYRYEGPAFWLGQ